MRKSLLAALIFAACGLVFLAVTGYLYYLSADAEQQASANWNDTETLRGDLLAKQNELSALGYVPTPKGADIPTILIALRNECTISEANFKYTTKSSGGGSKAGQGEQYQVVIDKISMIDLGKFLAKLRTAYPFLKVTDMSASAPAGAGVYKWSLTVESMSPAGAVGGAAAAGPEAAESPVTDTSAAAAAIPASSEKAKP